MKLAAGMIVLCALWVASFTLGQPTATCTRIQGQLSPDATSITFACITGATCPLQFGSVVESATTAPPITISKIPNSAQMGLALFSYAYNVGLTVRTQNLTVTCGGCTQIPVDTVVGGLGYPWGEIPLGTATANPQTGTWIQLTDGWVGAQAQPVISIVTVPGITDPNTPICSQATGPQAVTITCSNP